MARSNYKNRKPYRGSNRNNPKGTNKSEEFKDKSKRDKETTNDPAWYSKNPQLVADVGSLFFSNPLGGAVPKLNDAAIAKGDRVLPVGMYAFPGIMRVEMVTGPGASWGNSSPVNALSRGIYSYIRHMNSGSKNYDAPDLMIYLLGIDAALNYWAKLVRVYGIARHFNPKSRYLAKYYLEAMGFDADNILGNLAQLRYTINQFAVQLSNFCVPSTMDYFKRHTDMFLNIYKDSDDPKSQNYILDTAGYYTFDQVNGQLVFNAWPNFSMTISDITAICNSILSNIVGNEDFNIMSGDILKAYTSSKIWGIPMIPQDYVTPFVKDDVMLSQLENCNSIHGGAFVTGSLNVTQDPSTGALLWRPATTADMALMPRNLLNMHWQEPTSADIMEASRFMFTFEEDSTNPGTYFIRSSGSEIIIGFSIYTFTSPNTITPFILYQNAVSGDYGGMGVTLTTLALLENFGWHPRVTVWVTSGSSYILDYDSFRSDNYTNMPDPIVENLNNVALLSLFDVEHIGLIR